MSQSVRAAASATFAGLVAAGLLAGHAAPATAADGVVEGVTYQQVAGGYSPYLFLGCEALGVTISDATPSEASAYQVTVAGTEVVTLFSTVAAGSVTLTSVCPQDLVDGTAYEVTVVEDGGSPTPPFAFVHQQVQAPTLGVPVLTDGTFSVGPSSVRLNGTFEAGSEIETKVVANEGGTRQAAVENAATELDIPSTYDAETNAIEFTVPRAAAGRFIWVSVVGSKPGEASNGLRLDPVRVAGEAAVPGYDRSWITNPGAKKGAAKVGQRVRVAAPVFASPDARAATTVGYRWFLDGKKLRTTQRSVKVTRPMKGKKLVLKATFSARGYQPYTHTIRFGRVRA